MNLPTVKKQASAPTIEKLPWSWCHATMALRPGLRARAHMGDLSGLLPAEGGAAIPAGKSAPAHSIAQRTEDKALLGEAHQPTS